MGAFDTLAAHALPCPGCGDRYWVSAQTKLLDPDYDEQGYLYPGQGRALPFDPAAIARAELWEREWLRVGEVAHADRAALLLNESERLTCACGAALVPLAHLRFATTGPDAGHVTLDALEVCDLRDPATLGRVDLVDLDWWWAASGWRAPRPDLEAIATRPRHARREALAAAMAQLLAPGPDAADDHHGWTWLEGPVGCEACGQTRTTSSTCFVTHPTEGARFFGDAWTGGALTLGTRVGPVPPALATDRLRGRFYRLRAPAPDTLVLVDHGHGYGCRCGAGRASVVARFRRDGDHLILDQLTWRALRTRADLDDVDWIECRSTRYLARPDLDDDERLRAVLAEHDLE